MGSREWDWFHIELPWVKAELRGQGFGRRFPRQAEQEHQRRGARAAFLYTFSFLAPEFSRKNGYEVFGQLQGLPDKHTRFDFSEDLRVEPPGRDCLAR